MVKVIISGILGSMGTRVQEACFNDSNIEIVAGIDRREGLLNNIPLYASLSDCKVKADVLIDFSNPALTDSIADYCAQTNTPLVLCTTGQDARQLACIEELSTRVPVFKSANMSMGIALLCSLAKKASLFLGDGFDVEILEKHHNKKLDAPSGTALLLADAVNSVNGQKYDYIYDRHNKKAPRESSEIGISSIRGGTIVGEHEVIFAGNDEVITLSHSAASKQVFATGAVNAAKFIVRQKPGLYDMESMVRGLV